METQRAAGPVRIGAVTLVPVMRATIRSDRGDSGYWIAAFSEPVAVVVYDSSGIRALGADASELALDTLIAQTPNLAAILAGLSTS